MSFEIHQNRVGRAQIERFDKTYVTFLHLQRFQLQSVPVTGRPLFCSHRSLGSNETTSASRWESPGLKWLRFCTPITSPDINDYPQMGGADPDI